MMLDRGHFRQWFAKRGGNARELVAQITEAGANVTPKIQKASLGKNSPLSPPQCYVIGIDLRHPRLRSILDGIEQYQEDKSVDNVVKLQR